MRAEALEGCPEAGLANDSGNCYLHYVIQNERRMPRFFGPVMGILLISIFVSWKLHRPAGTSERTCATCDIRKKPERHVVFIKAYYVLW